VAELWVAYDVDSIIESTQSPLHFAYAEEIQSYRQSYMQPYDHIVVSVSWILEVELSQFSAEHPAAC
jgi:hypothetical protein